MKTNILESIVEAKKVEVAERKSLYPEKLLQKSIYFDTACVSLRAYLQRNDLHGIIAEFKRKSPSKGIINEFASVETTTLGYMQAGASALSVLTDATFFGGSNQDLLTARKFNFCPILRKDFIIDEYQVLEAKSIGADAILLIAAILDKTSIQKLSGLAVALGMEVLFELHDEEDVEKIPDQEVILGINNRNLRTMTTDVTHSVEMIKKLPEKWLKVTESGIHDPQTWFMLRQAGFDGFLIGEQFMRHARPEKACRSFIQNLQNPIQC